MFMSEARYARGFLGNEAKLPAVIATQSQGPKRAPRGMQTAAMICTGRPRLPWILRTTASAISPPTGTARNKVKKSPACGMTAPARSDTAKPTTAPIA